MVRPTVEILDGLAKDARVNRLLWSILFAVTAILVITRLVRFHALPLFSVSPAVLRPSIDRTPIGIAVTDGCPIIGP
jgi:hypothetical protein